MNSIRVKIALIVALGVVVICAAVGYQFQRNYQRSLQTTSAESVRQSIEAFDNLRQDSVDMMSAAIQGFMGNRDITRAFASRDREGLLQATQPLYQSFRDRYGITHWNYWEPEPAGQAQVRGLTNFLRAQTPEKYGEFLERVTLSSVVEKKSFIEGLDLGNTGFALRVLHPLYDDGQLCGYFEIGKSISSFFSTMKDQSGCEYGLVLRKSCLDEKKWGSSRTSRGQRDNWMDMPDLVLASNTTEDEEIFRFDGGLEAVPDEGQSLGLVDRGGRTYTRGVFPLRDATGQKVGGVFVLRDITAAYAQMRQARTEALATVVVLLGLIGAGMITLFHRMIVLRLERLTRVATRVVGGEYDTEVALTSNDEIGRFERLFEQFRRVFVSLIHQVEDQERRAA